MKEAIELTCANCGKVLGLPAWDVKRRRKAGNKNIYCDMKCYGGHKRKKNLARDQEIRGLRYSKNGSKRFTLKQLGEQFGLTPQRIRAILKEAE